MEHRNLSGPPNITKNKEKSFCNVRSDLYVLRGGLNISALKLMNADLYDDLRIVLSVEKLA